MRVPVVVATLDQAGAGDAVLFEDSGTWPGAAAVFVPVARHAPGCACCGKRTASALALTALLHGRARRETAFFGRVVAVLRSAAGLCDLTTALESDPVVAACFRWQAQRTD